MTQGETKTQALSDSQKLNRFGLKTFWICIGKSIGHDDQASPKAAAWHRILRAHVTLAVMLGIHTTYEYCRGDPVGRPKYTPAQGRAI